jgi:HEAT repeat protein
MLLTPGCERSATRPPQQSAESTSTPAPELPALSGDLPAQAEQIVSGALADADPRLRANAIEVVASTRQVRLMPMVHKLLADPAIAIRFAALLAIGDTHYAMAKNDVASLLNDADLNVKIAAAYALSRLGEPDHYKEICTAVSNENQIVRANAALLLGKSGQKEGIPFLYWTLRRDDSSDMVAWQAAEAIAMLGDRRIYPKLWTKLISTYADDRVIGIRAMGALGTDEAKSAIVTTLDDPVPEVRLAAAEQLGKLGDSAGEAEVRAVFEKKLMANLDAQGQERIKTMAALALGEIGTERSARYLPQLLQDSSKGVRLAAAKAVLRRDMKKP